ncbi:MAG: hypothetical protein JNK05_07050 [Myxococcales bacterium]|nr:hypothetical protein [Myxococcales bacterium]
MRVPRWLAVVQAASLLVGCRSTNNTGNAGAGGSGGAEPVASVEACARTEPSDQPCASAGASCNGYVPCVREGGPNAPPPRCGMHRWRCQCTNSAEGSGALRWRCDVERHPAGPLPPPELALA